MGKLSDDAGRTALREQWVKEVVIFSMKLEISMVILRDSCLVRPLGGLIDTRLKVEVPVFYFHAGR